MNVIIIIMSRAPVGKCPECDGKLYFSHVDTSGLTIYGGEEFI